VAWQRDRVVYSGVSPPFYSYRQAPAAASSSLSLFAENSCLNRVPISRLPTSRSAWLCRSRRYLIGSRCCCCVSLSLTWFERTTEKI
jgi:hypothetical protein